MIKICLICSKKFTTIPFEIKKGHGKYCSRACYYESMKGNKRPEWVVRKIIKHHVGMLGKHHSKKTKEKISNGGKGKNLCEKNHNWKGDKASYIAIHRWVRAHYKKSICEFCQASDCILHMANKSRKYERLNPNDWLTLCVPCHKRYDLKKILK